MATMSEEYATLQARVSYVIYMGWHASNIHGSQSFWDGIAKDHEYYRNTMNTYGAKRA